mgnify:CR=1 FL=1
MAKKTFEDYGGYFINGVPYMDCKITGESIRNVSTDAVSVIGSSALTGLLHKKFPDTSKPSYTPTGRPAGWHFMNEFVDKDGNVFHKGKEQPKLKGTLKPTKVKPPKKRKKLTKDQKLYKRINDYKKRKKLRRGKK